MGRTWVSSHRVTTGRAAAQRLTARGRHERGPPLSFCLHPNSILLEVCVCAAASTSCRALCVFPRLTLQFQICEVESHCLEYIDRVKIYFSFPIGAIMPSITFLPYAPKLPLHGRISKILVVLSRSRFKEVVKL